MIDLKDVKLQFTKGRGPGGQHRNKTSSTVRATHVPTGIVVTIDGRYQHKNRKVALRTLDERVQAKRDGERAAVKKATRDRKIHERDVMRTYHFVRGVVKDHRTGKTASVKEVVGKGKLELVAP